MTNKHELIPRDWQVSDYCAKLGWYLVTIPAGSKGPTRFGWQQPEKALSDPDAARLYYEQNPNHNVGLLHGASGTCAVDIDNVEHTKMIFEELGIDFSELMQSAPQIIGRENRGKLIFKAPPDLITHKISWPVQDDPRKTEVVFELRAGAVQDVLPPSIHPDTGRPYEWAGRSIFDGLPELPTQLLILWREWDKFRPQMSAICPWRREPEFQPPRRPRPKGDGTSVIDAFNQAHDMHSLLVQYGYKQTAKDRYLSPNSTSGLAGVKLFKDGRAYSHHASDPFDNAHTFDAFELFLQFEHQGNVRKAVRKAARDAGLGNSETIATIKSGLEAGMLEPRRTFEELVAAAKELTNGDMGEVEAVTIEAAALTPIQRNQVFREIKQATKIPIGTLKEQIRGEINDDPDHLDLANVTLDKIGRENIICTSAFVWRWSDCGVWKQQNDRAVKQEVQAVINDQTVKVTSSQVNGVTDVLKSEIFSSDHEFNQGNPESVNCENGELELDRMDWVLLPHCREHYRTTQIPVTYDPQAKAPRFQVFLKQIFRDDPDQLDKIASVLELMGYSLMSHAQHERFVMLIGPGANGKSVLLAVLEALLGAKNVAGVQPANFDNRFQRAHLHQKLANIVTELKQGEVIADAALKAITSGEPATVEHKHKDPFVIRPFSTCWFGTNHMPRTLDFSEALFRRATILTFNRTFSSGEQDPNLKETLIKELPGILNMCLDAYRFALIIDFAKPQSSDAAKTEWRLEADQVEQFVEESCVPQCDARAKVGDVFKAYIFWADDNGIKKTMAQKGFRDRLTRLGYGTDRDRANRYVTGLTLTDQPLNG